MLEKAPVEMLNRRMSNKRISKARKTVRRSHVRCSAACDLAFLPVLEKATEGNSKPQNIEQANFEGKPLTLLFSQAPEHFQSGDDFVDHFSVNIRQTEVPARIPVGELLVVEAHQMQDRGV